MGTARHAYAHLWKTQRGASTTCAARRRTWQRWEDPVPGHMGGRNAGRHHRLAAMLYEWWPQKDVCATLFASEELINCILRRVTRLMRGAHRVGGRHNCIHIFPRMQLSVPFPHSTPSLPGIQHMSVIDSMRKCACSAPDSCFIVIWCYSSPWRQTKFESITRRSLRVRNNPCSILLRRRSVRSRETDYRGFSF